MASHLVVDTDVLIDAAHDRPEAVAALERCAAEASLTISVVTEMKLIIGCRGKAEQRAVDQFVRRFRVELLTAEASARAAALLRRYRLSHGLQIADALIAATALCLGCPLLTHNQRDYRFIEGLTLAPYP